jgi:hypothetical protein
MDSALSCRGNGQIIGPADDDDQFRSCRELGSRGVIWFSEVAMI